jgi:hypothetical protein
MRDPEEAYRRGFEQGMEFALYEVGAGRSDRDIREWLDRQRLLLERRSELLQKYQVWDRVFRSVKRSLRVTAEMEF